jgi:hypothetical protein
LGGILGLSWLLDGGALTLSVAAFGPTGGAAVLVLVLGAVALHFGVRVHSRARLIGGERLIVHTRGNSSVEVAAWHEAGHKRMAKRVGGRVAYAAVFPDGSGVTQLSLPRGATPAQRIAVDVAGEVGSGTSDGCGPDHAWRDAVLAELPHGDRAATSAEGYQLARRECTPGALRRDAQRLIERGRI